MLVKPLHFAILLALFSAHAVAQTAGSDADARTLDQVVVTGTRVSDRTVAESISPIDVITPETLTATGTTELATALSRALPSLNFPRPALVDGTDAVRPAQLRGLAPDQVLVLVNGKRRHSGAQINLNGSQGRGSAPVDLNAIPIASIERVEVLRDGASAQYGSDAIAGVINIVLKGGADGGRLEGRHGQFSAGDGKQSQLVGDAGVALGSGWLRFAGQASEADQTDRARPYLGSVTPTSAPAGRVVQRFGDPDVELGALSLNSEFAIGNSATFYAFGAASNRDVISTGFFRPAGDSRNIPSIYPDGFLPQILNTSKDRSIVAGVRGTFANDLAYDLSYNYGYNHLEFGVANSLNRSLGEASPTRFYAGALESTQNVVNADFSKSFDVGFLAYPLLFAFGAEYRSEKYNISPGEPASYINGGVLLPGGVPAPSGAQVFPGFPPSVATHSDRDNISLYIGLEADITEQFSAGLAARYEDYSDFGSTTSGKLSGRYAFTDSVALRGTVATGFRAPSLAQQYFQSTSTTFIGGVPYEIRTFGVNDPVAIALGAEPLQAEESTSVSLGLVLQPLDDLFVTLDAYQIEIDDRVVLSENLVDSGTSTAVRDFLAARGIFGVTGGRYFTNAIDTKTRGVDLVGTYRWDFGNLGQLDLTAGYNRTDTDITHIAPNPAALTQGGLNLQRIGRVEQGRVTVGAPEDKFSLGSVWHYGDFTLNLTATHYGEFTVLNANPTQDQTFGAEWVVDLAATYALSNWDFTLGADNVFDAYPDEVLFANSTSGQLPYSSSSPFGFNGAFLYAKVGVRW